MLINYNYYIKYCKYLLLALILFFSESNIKAQEYYVSGTLKEFVYFPTNSGCKYINFYAYISGCKYFIITSYTNRGDPDKLNYSARLYDGTNYYLLTRLGVPKEETNVFASYIAIIKTNNEIYEEIAAEAGFVWLAYASHCYLKTITNNKINPLWYTSDDTIKNSECWIDAIIKKYDDNVGLPFKITYVENGDIKFPGRRGENPIFIKAPPPYDRGYIKAVYEVSKTSTELGFSIPTEFTFEILSTPYHLERQYLRMVISGYANSIKKGSIPIALPVAQYIHVVDWRRPSVFIESNETLLTPVSYKVISNKWPDEKDLMIARLDKENMLLRSIPTPNTIIEIRQISKPKPFSFIVVFILIIPLIYVAYRIIKKR